MITLEQLLEENPDEFVENFVQLLDRNYEELIDPKCKDMVLLYMRNTQSVLDRDIVFIKKLTKVAQHIVDSHADCFDEHLVERLYKFNGEGILMINKILKTRDFRYFTVGNLSKLASHLYGYRADAARRRAELAIKNHQSLDVQIQWIENAYWDRIRSAKMSERLEPLHSAHLHGFAGVDARIRLELGIKNKEGLDIQMEWVKRVYYNHIKPARITEESEPLLSALLYSRAGHAAKIGFELATELGEGIDFLIMLAKLWYKADIKSGSMYVGLEPLYSAHAHGFAGDAKRTRYKLTKEPEHAEEAIRCYTIFLDYYESNPNPEMNRRIHIIKDNIDYLKQSLSNLPP